MRRKRSRAHPWTEQPGKLVIHDDPYDIQAKLTWETNEVHLKRTGEPPLDLDGMVYLLQNACISAVAFVEWLKLAATRQARVATVKFDETSFEAVVAEWLPDLPLARAVANTFKDGTYRDEGWGDAELKLDAVFTDEQHSRLRAAKSGEDFARVYADESVEADYDFSFICNGRSGRIKAEDFLLTLDHGGLRLLDHTYQDLDRFFTQAGPDG